MEENGTIMAKELSNQAKWKPWKGVVLFVIAFVWLIVGSIASYFLGTYATLIIQLGFLGIAIAACLINKTPLKEVFPIRKFTARDFFGTILMWLGAMPLGLLSGVIVGKFMPETFTNVTAGLNEMTTSVVVIGLIATVICPPICEEAIMRGAVLSNFRSVKKDWVIIIIIGIMFGILHTDPIRFINTSLMGGCLAYLMVKRNNILLPAIYHFANNLVTMGMSTISTLTAQQAGQAIDASEATAAAVDALPSLMLMAFLSPLFLVIGIHLIKRQTEIAEGKEKSGMKLGAKIGLSVIPCVLLLGGGIALTVMSMNI
ncbi:MAG: CPBP family intramembrane metalloprotease [Clostridiales bacterium]|nr:CPBP family intramembrane metalloprotease [Clostridiales bacterium]